MRSRLSPPCWLVPLLVAALALSGCGARAKNCASPDLYCVGLVTSLGPVDSGLNQQAWLALQDALSTHLVDRIDHLETVDARDRLANIRAFADLGYDLIVTVGAPIANETTKAAALYPRLRFIGVEQPQKKKLKNLSGLIFREDFGGFLAGALAARMTTTGQVAAVCDAKFVDAMRRYCDGFVAGAQHIDPDILAEAVYRDGSAKDLFRDPAWGRTTALALVGRGADVIFAAGGRTADAALEAAAAQGAFVIGSESDLYLDLPDIRARLLTSATNDVRSGLSQLITLARRGKFPAGDFTGPVKLAPWHDFDRQISLETKQELDRLYLRLTLEVIPLDIPYESPE